MNAVGLINFLCRFSRGVKNSGQFIRLFPQRPNHISRNQRRFGQEFEPIGSLIRFFFGYGELRDELRLASSPAGGPIVRPNGRSASDNLLEQNSASGGIWHLARQSHNAEGERLGPLLHLGRCHAPARISYSAMAVNPNLHAAGESTSLFFRASELISNLKS